MRHYYFALAILIGCADPPVEPPENHAPPAIIVRGDPGCDLDRDGLVDVHIMWAPQDAVDTSNIVITALDGDSARGVNLYRVWRTSATDTSIVVQETMEQMLSFGDVRLEVAVKDYADNAAVDTIRISLPPGKLIKTLRTARSGTTTDRAFDLTICDDGLGYMPAGPYMVIFDPDSLRVIAEVRNPHTMLELNHLVCGSDGVVYVTPRVHRFNRTTRSWLTPVSGTYDAHAIVSSGSNPEILFIGERGGGVTRFYTPTRRPAQCSVHDKRCCWSEPRADHYSRYVAVAAAEVVASSNTEYSTDKCPCTGMGVAICSTCDVSHRERAADRWTANRRS